MYVAMKADGLRLAVKDDSGKQVGVKVLMPGDPIPDEEIGSWSYLNLVAHLNCEWIKWKGEGTPKHKEHHAGRVVDIRDYRGEQPTEPTKPDTIENQCADCGVVFKSLSGLKMHTKHKHAGPKGAA